MNLALDYNNLVVGCLVGALNDYIGLGGLVRVFGTLGVVGLRVVGLTLEAFVGAFLAFTAIGMLVAWLRIAVLLGMAPLSALLTFGLVEEVAITSFVSIFPAVITMITQVSVAAI